MRPFRWLPVLLATWLPAGPAAAATLQVTVHGIRNDRGHIRIGICSKAEFLSEACAYHAVMPAHPGDIKAVVSGVAPGRYAVAAYQDEDNSGKLKRNFFGLPREDLGFSRDPALGLGPPSFESSALTIGPGNSQIALTLHHFGT